MKLKKVWRDPVWSKVIAAVIIGVVAATLKLVAEKADPTTRAFWDRMLGGSSAVHFVTIAIVVTGVALILLVVWAHQIRKRSQEVMKLALKYSQDQSFFEYFASGNQEGLTHSLIGHTPETLNLLSEMEKDKLLEKKRRPPALSGLGKLVKEKAQSEKLGLFA